MKLTEEDYTISRHVDKQNFNSLVLARAVMQRKLEILGWKA
jgi:hypothetical protein